MVVLVGDGLFSFERINEGAFLLWSTLFYNYFFVTEVGCFKCLIHLLV